MRERQDITMDSTTAGNSNVGRKSLPDLSDDLTIRIKMKFLLALMAAIVGAATFIAILRSDVVRLLETVATQQSSIAINQQAIMTLQGNIATMNMRFETFIEQYNKDMDRYIRDRNDRATR